MPATQAEKVARGQLTVTLGPSPRVPSLPSQTRIDRSVDIASPSPATGSYSVVKQSPSVSPLKTVGREGASEVWPHQGRKLPEMEGQKAASEISRKEWGILEGSSPSSDESLESSSTEPEETGTEQSGVNLIHFEPTGFSSIPREPETLGQTDRETLAAQLETKGRATGRPHRIPGTLAQSKVVSMLLDTGAPCSLMPTKLFLQLQKFKPSLTLTPTTRALRGVEGSSLSIKGIAVVDVEFAGQYLLVPFTVVDQVEEVILGMDFLQIDGIEWNVSKGELRLGDGGTVYTHNTDAGPTMPSSKAQLVGRTFIPANSIAKVRVKFKTRGLSLPSPGVLTMTGRAVGRYGVVVTRAIVDPGKDGVCAVMMMNPTEHAVELPEGTTVAVLEPVQSLQRTEPATRDGTKNNSDLEKTGGSIAEPEDSTVGEDVSGYDGSSETSTNSLEESTAWMAAESRITGQLAKAAAPRSSGNRLPPAESSPKQARVVDGPEILSEAVLAVGDQAECDPTAQKAEAAPSVQVPADEENTVPEHLKKLYDATAAGLDDEHDLALVRQVLRRNADIFAQSSTDLGSTNVTTHTINTGDRPPIKQAPRRVALHRQEIVRQEVETMLEKGIIEPCDGPWSSPIVLAKKKDGSLRFCIDYRKLNEATLKDAYPLPRIEDNLDTLGGSTWFSTLDLISGFWQVDMDEESRAKTAFTVGRGGLYQFRRMPFGLCNAPATFQRLMEKVLAGLQWEIAVLYIDDIVVFGSSIPEHLARLEILFDRLRKAGLKLKPSKCALLQRKVEFLGHIVSADGVEADPAKIEKVQNWPQPKDLHEVRAFIGLCAYYRRFVRGFGDVCKPLYRLTEKGVPFHWGDEQEKAFVTMKERLTTAPILAFPNETDKFVLDTDASAFGIGGVLSQVQNGEERVIAYGSRVLNKAERNYCVTRRELLAIVDFVKMFHHYLVGAQFLLRTDHAALYWLFGMKNLEGQPARWVERLGCYDMVIQHRPGKLHGNADTMSRCPPRCTQTPMVTGPDGTELDLEDFQTIRYFTETDRFDAIEVHSLDGDWSDDQWGDDEPLTAEQIAAGEPAYPEHEQIPCVCRVRTRAQANRYDEDSDTEDPVARPADLPAAALQPRVRRKKITRTVNTKPPKEASGKTDPTPAKDQPPIDEKAAGDGRPVDEGVMRPTAPARPEPAKAKKPVGRPRLDQGPTMDEILELQRQQQFLKENPPMTWTEKEIAHMQKQDPDVAQLRKWVKDKRVPPWHEVAKEGYVLKTWWARIEQLILSENDILYLFWEHDKFSKSCPTYRVVTPASLRPYILRELHDAKTAAHMGMRKTRERAFRSQFFWPGMSTYVRRWVRNCLKCGSRKKPQYSRRQPMQTYRVGAKLDTVSIDILGPFKPRTAHGNVSILTITDHFTRWVNAYPLRDATAVKIARCVVDFIAQFGMPKHLHSDQGSNVDGSVIGEVCKLLGISKTHTCPWHPQGNAITERENKVIVDMLSHFVNKRQTDWDEHLPVVMMAYRSSVHRMLGESPASMMFGHELRLPIDAMLGPPPEAGHEPEASTDYVQSLGDALQDAHAVVRDRLESHYRYEKKQYDRKIQFQQFAVGQAVWLRNFPKTTTKSKKLMKPYSGPHIVIAKVNAVTYKIKLSQKVDKVVHGDRLKPFYGTVDDKYLRAAWVPLARGTTISDDTGAYEGVAVVFEQDSHEQIVSYFENRREQVSL